MKFDEDNFLKIIDQRIKSVSLIDQLVYPENRITVPEDDVTRYDSIKSSLSAFIKSCEGKIEFRQRFGHHVFERDVNAPFLFFTHNSALSFAERRDEIAEKIVYEIKFPITEFNKVKGVPVTLKLLTEIEYSKIRSSLGIIETGLRFIHNTKRPLLYLGQLFCVFRIKRVEGQED